MKCLTNFLLVFILTTLMWECVRAQSNQKIKFIYGSIGFGNGNGRTIDFALNAVASKGFYFNTTFYAISYRPVNKPANYQAETAFLIPVSAPHDYIKALSFNMGGWFYSKNKQNRIGLEAGPTIIWNDETVFKSEPVDPYSQLFSSLFLSSPSNYTTTKIHHNGFGLNLKARKEFPVSKDFGFELAIRSNINKYHPYIGLEGNFSFGKFGDKMKK